MEKLSVFYPKQHTPILSNNFLLTVFPQLLFYQCQIDHLIFSTQLFHANPGCIQSTKLCTRGKANIHDNISNYHVSLHVRSSCARKQSLLNLCKLQMQLFVRFSPEKYCRFHSISKSQSGLGWRGPWRSSSTTPVLWEGRAFSRSGCLELHSTWP